jgi:hypothetical protein
MKKSLVLGVITLGAASMLCGFDTAETVESLSAKMTEAEAEMDGLSMEMTMNLDAPLNISDGTNTSTLAINAGATLSADYTVSPFAMKMDGTVNVSALTANQTISEQAYAVTDENGDLKMYVYAEDSSTGEGEWTVQTADGLNIEELMVQSSSLSLSDMADWGISFELAPEAADVDGTECYLLSTTMDVSTLETLLNYSAELIGEEMPEDLSTYLALLEGLKLNVEYYIDAATYLPVKVHMDMEGSDLSIINQLITAQIASATSDEAASSTAELVLNDLSIDAVYTYGDIAEIVVPDEALAAEAENGTTDLSDLADEVENSLE